MYPLVNIKHSHSHHSNAFFIGLISKEMNKKKKNYNTPTEMQAMGVRKFKCSSKNNNNHIFLDLSLSHSLHPSHFQAKSSKNLDGVYDLKRTYKHMFHSCLNRLLH